MKLDECQWLKRPQQCAASQLSLQNLTSDSFARPSFLWRRAQTFQCRFNVEPHLDEKQKWGRPDDVRYSDSSNRSCVVARLPHMVPEAVHETLRFAVSTSYSRDQTANLAGQRTVVLPQKVGDRHVLGLVIQCIVCTCKMSHDSRLNSAPRILSYDYWKQATDQHTPVF